MKIKQGYMLRKVGTDYIAVACDASDINFNGVITLNETGAILWGALEKGASEQDLLKEMLSRYEIPEKIALDDIRSFINALSKKGLIEE